VSASDRLEARAIWRSMEQLASQWPGLGEAGRRAGLTDIANQVLALRDVPNVRVIAEKPAAGNDGDFHYKQWAIRMDPALINAPHMPPDVVAFMSDLARHEVEHVLQWWSMARLRASQKRTAAEIVSDMHDIPEDVARAAVASVEGNGMSAAEQAAAQVWWDNIYSPASRRNEQLDARTFHRELLDQVEADIAAARARGERPDRELVGKRDDLRVKVAGFDAIYRNFAEEVTAYAQGGAARSEARLMEAELQVDLAETALKDAVDDLKAVEDDYLALIAGGKDAPAEMAYDHQQELERVRLLTERADAARRQRDWVAGGIGPPAAPQPAAPVAAPGPAGAAPGPASQPPRPAGGPARPRNPAVEEGLAWIRTRFERRGLEIEILGSGSLEDLRNALSASADPAASIAALRQQATQLMRDIEIRQSAAELEGRGAPTALDPVGGESARRFRPPLRDDGSIDPVATARWVRGNGLDQPLELGAAIRYGPLDPLGRPTGISALLKPGQLEGGFEAEFTPAGFGGQDANHARGHLLGNQLGGSGSDPRNIAVLYHLGTNTPVMRDLENRIARAVAGGETVVYEVIPVFQGDSPLPAGVRIRAKGARLDIDQLIPNEGLAAALPGSG
jgi:hypothetical protein